MPNAWSDPVPPRVRRLKREGDVTEGCRVGKIRYNGEKFHVEVKHPDELTTHYPKKIKPPSDEAQGQNVRS